jgi:tRNA pseudouridine55 synthase
MTSHDVVAVVRRRLGEKRIGHAGTLDPDATGVLVLGIGRATRLLRFIEIHPKEYLAEMIFGAETTTQDASGEVIAEHDSSALTREDVERSAVQMVGEIEQIPPMVSAVKVGGERLYRAARRGEEVERAPRRVVVHALGVEAFAPGERASARVRVRCSRGTYVRTIAHDLGRALGVGGHVATLRRVRVGPFDEQHAISPEAATETHVRPVLDAVAGYPRREVTADEATAMVQGRALPAFGAAGAYAVVSNGALVAMAEDRADESRSICVVGDPGGDVS